MKGLKLLISPAALCLWAIALSVGFSIGGSNASRVITLKQETKFGYAQASFPVQMKRWDENLFNLLSVRVKSDMAELLRNAEQDAAAKPGAQEDVSWKPYSHTVRFIEQFRTFTLVSYLEIDNSVQGNASPAIGFRTINFDKEKNRELLLSDFLEGAADRSKALEALANYARSDLREQTGEEDEDSEELLKLARPDLSVYEKFTLCPSTKAGKAAGLTIHFPPTGDGPYAGSDFHVTIPFTVYSKFLKPGIKALFAGEPRQTPVSLQDAEL